MPSTPRCPPGRYPVLTAIAPDMTGVDADDRFEFGLNVLIAGLEAASAAEKADQHHDGRAT
jgi:Tetracyclin repressor-like, C-terminal domain